MAKKQAAAAAESEGEIIGGPGEESTESRQPKRQNPRGWTPERLRHPDGVRPSRIKPAPEPYEPKYSSDAYLGVNFGTAPDDIPNGIGQMVAGTLEAVKESWKQVDQSRGSIMSNTMETEHKRLDQLDQFAQKRWGRASAAVKHALEQIDDELDRLDKGTADSFKPKNDEVPLISMWQATLANKSKDELREIVSGAIDAGHSLTLKATLGAPDWMVPMGNLRDEMVHRYEDLGPVVGKHSVASYRKRLHDIKERLGNTQKSVKEHFSTVLTTQQKMDLQKARERQKVSQSI